MKPRSKERFTQTCPRCGKSGPKGGMATHEKYCGKFDELFWEKVNKGGPNGCWVWTGYRQKFGHGWTRFGLAHRYSWEKLRGQVPDGKFVLHHCDNPPCVNPEHLYIGVRDDNARDMKVRRRSTWGERNWNAVLTEQQVKEIKARYVRYNRRRGNSKDLASEYGCSVQAVLSIVAGRTWKHLT